MKLIKCSEETRVGDYVSDNEYIAGFVGIDEEGDIVTETCEMYSDAQYPFTVEVRAVVKER